MNSSLTSRPSAGCCAKRRWWGSEVLAACMRHGMGEEDNSIVIEEIRRRIW